MVEVILAAVIMVVLLASIAPRFKETSLRLRTEHAAFELAQLLRNGRERAVMEHRVVYWVWDAETKRARLEAADEYGERQHLAGRGSQSAKLPQGFSVMLMREDAPVYELQFFPDGTGEATTLSISSKKHLYTITVDATTGQAVLSAGSATS